VAWHAARQADQVSMVPLPQTCPACRHSRSDGARSARTSVIQAAEATPREKSPPAQPRHSSPTRPRHARQHSHRSLSGTRYQQRRSSSSRAPSPWQQQPSQPRWPRPEPQAPARTCRRSGRSDQETHRDRIQLLPPTGRPLAHRHAVQGRPQLPGSSRPEAGTDALVAVADVAGRREDPCPAGPVAASAGQVHDLEQEWSGWRHPRGTHSRRAPGLPAAQGAVSGRQPRTRTGQCSLSGRAG
jgi:hypothetical protein